MTEDLNTQSTVDTVESNPYLIKRYGASHTAPLIPHFQICTNCRKYFDFIHQYATITW